MMKDTNSLCIKVIGVGGAGSNTVDRMIQVGLNGVEFIAANTDVQALAQSEAFHRLQLGPRVAKGLGVGGDPEWGTRAAEESQEAIRQALRGAHVVFIAAGMGGGTGTGAAPVVAHIAREQDTLTIAAVTRPFSFEGPRRRRIAEAGIMALSRYVHSLIVISNDRLLPLVGRDMTFDVALRVADDVLRQGIQGISELITRPGLVNLDFASIRTALEGAGGALMAIGRGRGEGKAVQAAQAALNSPLLNFQLLSSAETILVNITGGPDLTLHEVSEATQLISEASHPGADILFGAIIDPQMEGEARVILVAGGIDTWGQEKMEPVPFRAPAHKEQGPSAQAFELPIPVSWSVGSTSKPQAGGDRRQDIYLAEPIPCTTYWSAQGDVNDSPPAHWSGGELHSMTPPSPLPARPSPVPASAMVQPALSPSASLEINSAEGTALPEGPNLATGPACPERQFKGADRGKPEAESERKGYGERILLRFLPNLDFPAFLRR